MLDRKAQQLTHVSHEQAVVMQQEVLLLIQVNSYLLRQRGLEWRDSTAESDVLQG